ncbi:MAG: VOC family protein [Steroidobacteraceae bacterium]|nr:VOC family protein [Steroidobacteraceae bacterium]MCC7200480.1 VOC family protein [Gammaproteobacteria bacterium]
MIGYVMLGTNDVEASSKFYDELLALLGAKRFMETDRGYAWMTTWEQCGLGVMKPFDGKPATVGNGVMVALACDSPAKVDEVYAKALSLGGTDEGPPGPRGEGFYAAYFRDLDGNKLDAFCMTAPAGG